MSKIDVCQSFFEPLSWYIGDEVSIVVSERYIRIRRGLEDQLKSERVSDLSSV